MADKDDALSRYSRERWIEIDRLIQRALEIPEELRASFVNHSCGDDRALAEEVLELLATDGSEHAILDHTAERFAAPLLENLPGKPDQMMGARIGPYRIVEEIGRGGMGAVYLAERADGEFEKRVALKLVKRGMDSEDIVRRFQLERRVLASLQHPNIAALHDGGVSDDGRPYLVMEYIDGQPIDRHCDELRLGIEARLALFRTVCRAVQHAHQNLVIHRDIKPSNILISSAGEVKLLDFGVAKLLDPSSDGSDLQTRTHIRLLTPAYASPEHRAGRPLTAGSDVYSLGILLYELLTGRHPSRVTDEEGVASGESARVPKPSRAVTLSGPSDPRRTGDAAGSAGDVAARASMRGLSVERLSRRLHGDLDIVVLKALEANPEERYPSVQSLLDDIGRHLARLPILARPPTRWYRATKFVRRNRLAVAAAGMIAATMVGGLATTTWQARRAAAERDMAEAQRARAEAVTAFLLDLFDSADPMGPGDAQRGDTLRVRTLVELGADRVRRELAGQTATQSEMLVVLGRVFVSLGAYDQAEDLLNDAVAARLAAGANDRQTALGLAQLGRIAKERGDFPRADSLYRDALDILAVSPLAADSVRVSLITERGTVLAYDGRFDEALAMHEMALNLAAASEFDEGAVQARVLNNLATLHYDLGDYARAESRFREALEIERRSRPFEHPAVASLLNNLAASIHYQGRYDEAEPLYRQAIESGRRTLGDTHSEVGDYLQNLGTLYDDVRRYDEAETLYRQAVAIYTSAFGRRSVRTAMLIRNFALNRDVVGATGEAITLLREATEILEEELGTDHIYAAISSAALGRLLTAAGEMGEAHDRIVASIEVMERSLPGDHFLVLAATRDLGAWYARSGDFPRAEALLLASHAGLEVDRGTDHYLTVGAREFLRNLYLDWGRPEQAEHYEVSLARGNDDPHF
jgi:eukaryotic-like serine/threonine-protein kinase